MKIKKFYAKNTREGMKMVKQELGDDAIIFSNKRKGNGVEIVAAQDAKESLLNNVDDANPIVENKKVQEYSLAENKIIDDTLPLINKNVVKEQLPEKVELEELNSVMELESPHEKIILNLQSEIKSLRSLLEEQLSGMVWNNKNKKNPNQAHIVRKLAGYGFSSTITNNLVHGLDSNLTLEDAWITVKEKLISALKHITSVTDELSGSYVFLGPTGSGKTLTIAKIAAQYAMKYGAEHIAILNCDCKKIGAFDQLKIYGRILDVTVKNVDDSEELNNTLMSLKSKKLILIDTPGISINNPKLKDSLSIFCETALMHKFLLVLPSNINYQFATKCFEYYSKMFKLYSSILTKVDENFNLGGIISVLLEKQMKVHFTCDGHNIPDDLSIAKAANLMQKIFNSNIVKTNFSEDEIARNYTEDKLNDITEG